MQAKIEVHEDGTFTITGQLFPEPRKSNGPAGKLLVASGGVEGVMLSKVSKKPVLLGGQFNIWVK